MIVAKQQIAAILAGRRTWDLRPLEHHPDGTIKDFRLGNHPVSRRGGPAVCRIHIHTATLVNLDDYTDHDARAAGYDSLGDWLGEYCNTHNTAWTSRQAWRVEFEVLAPRDVVHLLANQNGRRNAGQYTSSRAHALPDEPEAVSPGAVRAISAASREERDREREKRAARYRDLPLEVRLAQAKRDANEHHVNISSELRVIERRLAAIEQKTGRAA